MTSVYPTLRTASARRRDQRSKELDGQAGAAEPSTRAYVWGDNTAGALGVGGVARAMKPVPVRLPVGTVEVEGGDDFLVARTAAREVWTWGGNGSGQLGDGATAPSSVPRRVTLPGRARVVDVDAGSRHVIAVSHDHRVFTWGRNRRGQLGDGSTVDRATPVEVDVPGDVVGVAAGNDVSLAVTADGSLYAWGQGDAGQLGSGAVDVLVPTAVALPSGTRIADAVAGLHHTVALTSDGRLLTWGRDVLGRPLPAFLDMGSAAVVTRIASGDNHVVLLTDAGTVFAFGDDGHGQLGDGDGIDPSRIISPGVVEVPGATGPIVGIAAGGNHTVVVTSTGQVFTWGANTFGELGTGTGTGDATSPVLVSALTGAHVTAVRAGRYQTVATVQHGAPALLRVTPSVHIVAPGAPIGVRVEKVDAFGHTVGPATGVRLSISGGTCRTRHCRVDAVGPQQIRATAGALRGVARVTVRSQPPPGTTPTPVLLTRATVAVLAVSAASVGLGHLIRTIARHRGL